MGVHGAPYSCDPVTQALDEIEVDVGQKASATAGSGDKTRFKRPHSTAADQNHAKAVSGCTEGDKAGLPAVSRRGLAARCAAAAAAAVGAAAHTTQRQLITARDQAAAFLRKVRGFH